tara:strand:+ start:1017 stop:2147 length:1131 start_codon:yes stop_codon:yes gene_type:complete
MSDLQQEVLYHQVQPQSIQDVYNQFNQIDFLISVGDGRSLVKNSVRVLADVEVQSIAGSPGTRASGGILFNRNVGGHAFVDSLSVSAANLGLIETLSSYPRWVNTDAVTSLDNLDMLNALNQCELRGVNNAAMLGYSNGIQQTITTGTAVMKDADFSIRPLCCLNRMTGDDLPYAKSGIITLNLNLARNMDALFGKNQDANSLYLLKNVRCSYRSVLTPKTPSQSVMRVEYGVKSNILSGTASLSANIPAVCEGVTINFIQTQHDSVPVYDSYALETLQQLESMAFIMNDKTNSLITYNLTDTTEILERAVSSMFNTGRNQVSIDKYRANASFVAGLDFDGGIDLSQNRFTFQVVSGVNNTNPVNVYMYFHSAVTI